MGWSFALINGKLAEIFFDHKKDGELVIRGFCYVKANEYISKREKRWIMIDSEQYRFTYRNKKYFDRIKQRWVASGSFPRR